MQSNSQTHAILLLTVSLGKADDDLGKPLSVSEWARFASWLRSRGLQPQDLMRDDPKALLSDWIDRKVTLSRIEALLERGGALALRLERWERAGLRVLTRAESEYPSSFKERLKEQSPAVLFVTGNTALLHNGGIAVVGSRNASEEDCQFASSFASLAAVQGYSIVSGGARGIDQSAMLGALEQEGTVVGVLSGGLMADSSSAKYRKYIMSGDLTLISPFNPEAGFNVGNAMGRNRYIYCLANAAVVMDSDLNKGGTWNGAIENLKGGWVSLWVKDNGRADSGNPELVSRGGRWLPEQLPDIRVLLDRTPPVTLPTLTDFETPQTPLETTLEPEVSSVASDEAPTGKAFYDLFMKFMERATVNNPLSAREIAEAIEVGPGQVEDWLKRGMKEQRLEKLSRPVRYRSRIEKGFLQLE
jgi:predicted Rossmann fold nucleotide-binding protein DprA/Smf involved in DNA uptake